MTIHGTVIDLEAGDYTAQVGQVGATLLSLRHRDHQLVDPVAPDQLGDAWQGRTLVPWPNRVVGGRYTVRGTTYGLPVNEPETGAALHGLAAFQRWDRAERGVSSVSWALDLPASFGYPFQVRCVTTYALDADRGLTITVAGTNVGGEPAPFGASTHPYLTCDGHPLDECEVRLPAGSVLQTAEGGTPTQVVPVPQAELELDPARPLRGVTVDNAFTDLPDHWALELTHPVAPGVRVDSDAAWVQLYTGERIGRRGLAVEPMTCPPDAFNRDPEGVLLHPGTSRSVSLRLSALPPRA